MVKTTVYFVRQYAVVLIEHERRRYRMNHSISIAAVNFLNIIVSIYLYNFSYYEDFYNDTFGMKNTVILPVLLLVISIATDVIISFIFMTLELEPFVSVVGTAVCQLIVKFLLAFIIAVVSIVIAIVVSVILAIAGFIFAVLIIVIFASSC